MYLDNVIYHGEHSITFTRDGVSKNTWNDWGLIPSTRHSEPVNGIWAQAADIPGVNGQEDLVRLYPNNAVNSHDKLIHSLLDDNREDILGDPTRNYDIFQPSSGSLAFIIADQTVSFFTKQKEILDFLHDRTVTMVFADDPSKIFTVRTQVETINSAEKFSNLSIAYSVLNVT